MVSRTSRGYAMVLLVAAFTLSHVDRQIVAILAPSLRLEFGLSDTQLGLLTGFSFAVFHSLLAVPAALWADRGDRRLLITLALSAWSLMTVVCGLASNFAQLLLARIGVGVGEAGAGPPSHSLISDLYPPERRATALAVFASGVNLGILIGFSVGGWVDEHHGWRWAFFVAGAPGLPLALLLALTFKEPRRAPLTARWETERRVSEVLRTMWAHPVLRNTVVGAMLAATAGYSTIAWLPTFLVRTHGLRVSQVGLILGLMVGVLGSVGAIAGSWLADRLARRSAGWRGRVVSIALLIYLPLGAVAYSTDVTWLALLALSGPALLSTVHVGVNFGLLQNYSPVRMRARVAAVDLLIVNLVALGGGPLLVGALSDWFSLDGGNGLRTAMLFILAFVACAAVQFGRLATILDRLEEQSS